MKRFKRIFIASTLIGGVLVAGCGGGGGDTTLASGGLTGTGVVSAGSVEEIGSVTVNGVRYSTADATIYVNGVEQTLSDSDDPTQLRGIGLNEGQFMRVRGNINTDGITGEAVEVRYDSTLIGPVTAGPTDLGAGATGIEVMGLPVIIDDRTYPNPLGFTLAIGQLLEISGLAVNDGTGNITITAGYVEALAPSSSPADIVKIRGTVTSVNGISSEFNIGALTIAYSGTLPVVGQFVEVKGSWDGTATPPFLAADSVGTEIEIGLEDEDSAQFEGFVTDLNTYVGGTSPGGSFFMGSQEIQVSADTDFDGGVADMLTLGTRVEVEGELAGGVIYAEEISFEDEIEVTSVIEGIGTDSLTLYTPNVSASERVVATINSVTHIEGGLTNTFSDFAVNQKVEIRGRMSGSTLIATEVKIDDLVNTGDDVDVQFQGPVDSGYPMMTVISILGIQIDADQIGLDLEGSTNEDPTLDEFLAEAQAGVVVSAEGTYPHPNISLLTWEQLEIED